MAKSKTYDQGYNGNSNLPLPNDQYAYTAEELQELVKCQNDPIHFICKYVKIIHVDKGIVGFEMWEFQKEIVRTINENRFTICKLARQSGKSTVVVCGYFMWYLLFHTDVSIGIMANKEATAIQMLDRFKQSFELLPRFVKQGIVKWDQKLVKFANGSRMRAEATSSSAVRGDTFNIIFLDEFAFVPANIAEDFMRSAFPTITAGKTTKMIIVSTPQGYNSYYKLWNDAEQGRNDYKHLEFTWRDVPGRDELNKDGLNKWEVYTRKNIPGGDSAFEQEFNCSFMGSANTLIPAAKLSVMTYIEPKRTFWNGDLKIYHEPQRLTEGGPSHVYLCTVDVSQGQEQNFSVVNVTDLSEMPWKQVAVYRSNKVSPQMLAPIVKDIAMMYNNAYAFIEINTEGQIVASSLIDDMEYDNLITIKPHPKRGQMLSSGFNPQSRLGLKVTEATKKGGCAALKGIICEDKYVICDFDTLRELTTYVAHNKSFAADEGCTDDIVATMVLLGWLSAQTGFENYVGLSMRQLMARGHDPLTFDDPITGWRNVGETTLDWKVVQPNYQGKGYDVIEDNDFWKGDSK
jgi:Terminase large subunit, T4likevirus-type, N-terminal/Terminase RNaseH-like domain